MSWRHRIANPNRKAERETEKRQQKIGRATRLVVGVTELHKEHRHLGSHIFKIGKLLEGEDPEERIRQVEERVTPLLAEKAIRGWAVDIQASIRESQIIHRNKHGYGNPGEETWSWREVPRLVVSNVQPVLTLVESSPVEQEQAVGEQVAA